MLFSSFSLDEPTTCASRTHRMIKLLDEAEDDELAELEDEEGSKMQEVD